MSRKLRQKAVLDALDSGYELAEALERSGISGQALNRWLKADPAFRRDFHAWIDGRSQDDRHCRIEGCDGWTRGIYCRQHGGFPDLNPGGQNRYVRHEGRLLHRAVLERELGRILGPRENVHHKNGVRNDNRPENLELWAKPQPPGQRVEDLQEWVAATYEISDSP